jgi:prevent-host-death family protein
MVRNIIPLAEAQSRLPELLDRVQAGEVIALSRHGKEVALLTPLTQHPPRTRDVIEALRRERIGSRLDGLTPRELRDEGRP